MTSLCPAMASSKPRVLCLPQSLVLCRSYSLWRWRIELLTNVSTHLPERKHSTQRHGRHPVHRLLQHQEIRNATAALFHAGRQRQLAVRVPVHGAVTPPCIASQLHAVICATGVLLTTATQSRTAIVEWSSKIFRTIPVNVCVDSDWQSWMCGKLDVVAMTEVGLHWCWC